MASSAPAPLRALVVFEAAARHRSFSRAARELALTPSAVSHQVKSLENRLKLRLFERAPGGNVALTESGGLLWRRLATALALVDDAIDEVRGSAAGSELVVEVAESFAGKWLRPRLRLFLEAQPDARLRIVYPRAASALPRPPDIAIRYNMAETADEDDVLFRIEERLMPVCAPFLRARLPSVPSPADLLSLPLIDARNTIGWAEWLARFGGEVPAARIIHGPRLDRSQLAIEAALDGLGVVLESDLLIESELRDGRLVAVFSRDDGLRMEGAGYSVVTGQGRRHLRRVACFTGWLRHQLDKPTPSAELQEARSRRRLL
jgi:LysR family transcriptional regulator, glycine cleavage system transcriptional activator